MCSKLIKQASIDYVRYLEDCVTKLKAENGRRTPIPATRDDYMPLPPAAREPYNPTGDYGTYHGEEEEDEDEDVDVEMTSSEAPSPKYESVPSRSHHPSISPALLAQDSRNRGASISSATNDYRPYTYASSTTSPAFGPRPYEYAISTSASNSTLPSPALLPQRDIDQEATAALLMLNADRRGTNSSIGGRGMSVKDLLTS